MIDIDSYRQRIGCHYPKISNFSFKYSAEKNDNIHFWTKKKLIYVL